MKKRITSWRIMGIISSLGLIIVGVAYITVGERKLLGIGQRRVGPNKIGIKGLLQAFADALKLIFKEIILPIGAVWSLFGLSSILSLSFALAIYLVITYAPGTTLSDYHLGILYILAASSLGGYGILIGGWAGNSKYTLLGAIRCIAQFLSYELIISTSVLFNSVITGSLSLSEIIENQKKAWSIFSLYPVYNFFFIGALAETNRTPYDLAEAIN